ncbi:MAG: hypothetical protein RLZZ303_2128 [Candidatus Hydrogenedentota bacterium]|jgi:NAD(P)-dependent dehydrogenase (short-subunit alcohol dehydrogenase family)
MSERPVALVTGASRGIGRGIALALASSGFDVVGTATQAHPDDIVSGLNEVKAQAEALGGRFLPVAGDIACLDQHERMLTEALSLSGRIDCFVSNAGVAPLQRVDLLEMTSESYDRVMGINLKGALFFAQRVARAMVAAAPDAQRQVAPCMVFITSISAKAASANRTEYCISKAGLSMAARSFAVALAPHGINVYEIQPGIIATDMTSAVREKYNGLIDGGLLLTPRWGMPEDIGRAVAAFARGDFAYATGTVIEIGGGFGVERL